MFKPMKYQRCYEFVQSRIYKERYRQNIVIEYGNVEIIIGKMYNVLFMNEPIALQQVGSLVKNLPSEFTPVFWHEIYIGFWGLRSLGVKLLW